MSSSEDRYRTLLDAAYPFADQPTVKAVLHSLRGVLSNTCKIHGTFLYVLCDDGERLHVFEFDREADAPAIKVGPKFRALAVAQYLSTGTSFPLGCIAGCLNILSWFHLQPSLWPEAPICSGVYLPEAIRNPCGDKGSRAGVSP